MAKLFVGNLSWNAGDQDLESFFSQHGTVTEVKVVFDRDTNRSRGFGFVQFEEGTDLDSVIKAVAGTDFMGRDVRVSVAEERTRTPRANHSNYNDKGSQY